jgi:hypothetical protein
VEVDGFGAENKVIECGNADVLVHNFILLKNKKK